MCRLAMLVADPQALTFRRLFRQSVYGSCYGPSSYVRKNPNRSVCPLGYKLAYSIYCIGPVADSPAMVRVAPMNCQIEYVSSDSDSSMPCGKSAVAKCADCGATICSDCETECCGHSFCGQCYDYHVTTSYLRKPAQYERRIFDSQKAG
jgi:hypothetical protein